MIHYISVSDRQSASGGGIVASIYGGFRRIGLVWFGLVWFYGVFYYCGIADAGVSCAARVFYYCWYDTGRGGVPKGRGRRLDLGMAEIVDCPRFCYNIIIHTAFPGWDGMVLEVWV